MTSPTQFPPPLPPRRKSRWKIYLLAFILFFGGVLCGTGLTIAVAVHRIRYAIQHPEEAPDRIVWLLRRKLDLTPVQTSTVREILEQHQVRLQAIRRQIYPQIHDEFESFHSDVAAKLDDRQKEKWDHLYRETIDNWLPPPPR
ncbi:MAG TPA: hypothetical protein VFE58_08555 [Tepidisphaeraceae bacterium]|jgi:hypothetical protein|nr:hypothetical protein [Tepidisphaeraceae bacterium]